MKSNKDETLTDTVETQIPDILSMSDEEYLEFLGTSQTNSNISETSNEDTEDVEEVEESNEQEETNEESDTESDELSTTERTEKEEDTGKNDTVDPNTSVENTPNYKEAYEKIFTEIKANGKTFKPKDSEEVVRLVQQGLNYNKKMAEIKDIKKIAESVKQAKIDTERLNLLIDVNNGNPEAIKKLLKETKIDVLDLDLEEVNYVPNSNIVSDEALSFQSVVEEIAETPHYTKIVDVLTKQWDQKSKEFFTSDATGNNLMMFYEEVANGRFDIINERMEREALLGFDRNVPAIDRYKKHLFAYLEEQKTLNSGAKANTETVKEKVQKKQVVDPTINKSKALPNPKGGKVQELSKKAEDILSMSDEEYLKLSKR
jgi:hypothetical protein